MSYGGETADQVVRYTLEGTEVVLKLTGEAAIHFATFAAAVLRDQKKMHGKTNLTRLLREGKPLKFFVIPESRMREFAQEANARGLLFVPVKNKKIVNRVEIAVWAEDAAKVDRTLENMMLDVVEADTGAKADVKVENQPAKEVAVQTEMVKTGDGTLPVEISELDDVFSVGGNFMQRTELQVEEKKSPSERSSQPQSSSHLPLKQSADEIRAAGGKPSVKQELSELKAQHAQKQTLEKKPPVRQRAPRHKKTMKGR